MEEEWMEGYLFCATPKTLRGFPIPLVSNIGQRSVDSRSGIDASFREIRDGSAAN